MELKEFVKITLEQIVEGAALAQERIKQHGGIVNPSNMSYQRDGSWNVYEHAMPQEVAFDVGLTSTDKSGQRGRRLARFVNLAGVVDISSMLAQFPAR